jgi:hypothetical protein
MDKARELGQMMNRKKISTKCTKVHGSKELCKELVN